MCLWCRAGSFASVLTIPGRHQGVFCDALSRRGFLRIGMSGLGLGLRGWGTCFEQVGSWRVGPCFSSHDPSQMRGLPTLLLSRDGHLASIAQFPKSTHDGQWWDCRQRNGNWCFDSSMFFSRDDDFQGQFGPGCGGWETRNSTRWLRDVANVLASGLQLGRQRR